MNIAKFQSVIFSLFVALLFVNLKPIYAQENVVDDLIKTVENKGGESEEATQIDSLNQYFDISLIRGGQSAFTKGVTYTVKITPHIDSPRTQIQWSFPTALKISPKHKEFIAMQKGSTYTIKATILPQRGGTYPIAVSAISWQHDTNYINTARDNITFDKGLILNPPSQSYVVGNIAKFLLVFLLAGGAIFAVIKVVKKYTPKAKQWLTPPV